MLITVLKDLLNMIFPYIEIYTTSLEHVTLLNILDFSSPGALSLSQDTGIYLKIGYLNTSPIAAWSSNELQRL